MATSGQGTGIVGYNVQMAVEAEPWPASRKVVLPDVWL